jgi:hypothetical protein
MGLLNKKSGDFPIRSRPVRAAFGRKAKAQGRRRSWQGAGGPGIGLSGEIPPPELQRPGDRRKGRIPGLRGSTLNEKAWAARRRWPALWTLGLTGKGHRQADAKRGAQRRERGRGCRGADRNPGRRGAIVKSVFRGEGASGGGNFSEFCQSNGLSSRSIDACNPGRRPWVFQGNGSRV